MAKFSDLISGNTPVLIDFYADWCAPCKMMPPILKQVKDNFNDNLRIVKIDVDKNPAIAAKYNIRSVPTTMLFKNGKVLWNQAGVTPAEHLTSIIRNYLNMN